MDPISIAATCAGLTLRVFKVVKAIHSFTSKYKNADLIFASMLAECSIIAAILTQIQGIAQKYSDPLQQRFEREAQLSDVFEISLVSLVRVFSVIELKLKKADEDSRMKIVWNEKSWQSLLDLLARQITCLNLLISIMQR
jgi:hypothetical protein